MRLLKRDFFLAMNRTTTTWTPFFFLMITFFFFFVAFPCVLLLAVDNKRILSY